MNPPPTSIVMVCNSADAEMFRVCKKKRENAMNPEKCPGAKSGLRVVALDDPSPEELQRKMKELPNGTPVFLDGHGKMLGRNPLRPPSQTNPADVHYTAYPLGKGESGPLQMRLGNDRTYRAYGVTRTKSFYDAVQLPGRTYPLWLSQCHGGGACIPGMQCVGASCRKEEESFWNANDDSPEAIAGELIFGLWCREEEFHRASGGDGVLSPSDLARHLCGKFGGDFVTRQAVMVTREPQADEPILVSGLDRRPMNTKFVASEKELDAQETHLKLAYPNDIVTRRDLGKVMRIRFTDETGKVRTQVVKRYTRESVEEAARDYDESDRNWRKDCTEYIDGVRRATNCSIEEVGKYAVFTVKKKTGACTSGPFHAYHP